MQGDPKKIHKLKKRLEAVLTQQDLTLQKDVVQQLQHALNRPLDECAAALIYLVQLDLLQTERSQTPASPKDAMDIPAIAPAKPKSVRYRLDIGSVHQVTREEIETVLVNESGVDIKRITRVDIKQNFTIVELPDGMPADIFQLLSEAEIRHRKLRLKRLKSQRRNRRYRRQN